MGGLRGVVGLAEKWMNCVDLAQPPGPPPRFGLLRIVSSLCCSRLCASFHIAGGARREEDAHSAQRTGRRGSAGHNATGNQTGEHNTREGTPMNKLAADGRERASMSCGDRVSLNANWRDRPKIDPTQSARSRWMKRRRSSTNGAVCVISSGLVACGYVELAQATSAGGLDNRNEPNNRRF
jgi:hypothetical protein